MEKRHAKLTRRPLLVFHTTSKEEYDSYMKIVDAKGLLTSTRFCLFHYHFCDGDIIGYDKEETDEVMAYNFLTEESHDSLTDLEVTVKEVIL